MLKIIAEDVLEQTAVKEIRRPLIIDRWTILC